MARVYANTESATCNKKYKPDEAMSMKEWCIDSIPARDALVSGTRAGDYGLGGPLDNRWPKRQRVITGAFKLDNAFIKSSMCLKLPVCDTKMMMPIIRTGDSIYDTTGTSVDCSGRGQCRWNARLGNHCHCKPTWKNVHSKLCQCKAGMSKADCVKEMRKEETNAQDFVSAKQRNTLSPELVKTIESLVAKACANEKVNEIDDTVRTTQVLKTTEELGESSEVDDTAAGENSEQTDQDKEIPSREQESGFIRAIRQMAGQKRSGFRGPDKVSKKCHISEQEACQETDSCMWEDKCVDAATWQCGNQKKVLDCAATRLGSPNNIFPFLNGHCGKIVYNQTKITSSQCAIGLRASVKCTNDDECGPPNHRAKCVTQAQYRGCAAAAINKCADIGFGKMAVMGL